MEITCTKCSTTTKLDLSFEASYFACPNCKTIYFKARNDEFAFKTSCSEKTYLYAFSVGQKATFNNKEYKVTGVLIKKYKNVLRWAEYILQNDEGSFLYLSESDGNFILLEEIEYEKKVGNHPLVIEHENLSFDRYDYSYPDLSYASGFFDFNILERIELIEYINPPYILSFEKFEKTQIAYYGKHISRSAVKKAFKTSSIPSKSGIGVVQVFPINVRNLAIIFCTVAILILFSQLYINKDRKSQEVLNTSVPFNGFVSKDFVSPSFELKGGSAPLQINVSSNVDNSWANVQVALVNEITNEEIYASKDIEYYHGYTEGENWTEGSTTENFNICGVSAGKYHVTVVPTKAPEDTSNSFVTIKATWNEPSLRNFFMTIIFMAVFVILVYYWSKYFEYKRWEE